MAVDTNEKLEIHLARFQQRVLMTGHLPRAQEKLRLDALRDIEGELLTVDEQLARKPRWQGEVRDLPAAIRALARLHGLASEETIEESEDWFEFIDQLTKIIQQLIDGTKS